MTRTDAASRVPLSVLASYAAPCLPLAGLGLPLVVQLPSYYAREAGLPLAAVGAAFLLVRLADILFDPLVGAWMDATRPKMGRFRLWMLIGAPFTFAGTALAFFPPAGIGAVYLFAALALVYVGYSINVLAQTAWGASITPDYHQRSRIYGAWQAAYIIGMLGVLAMPIIAAAAGFRGPADGVRAMGLYILFGIPLAFGVMTLLTPERQDLSAIVHRRPSDALRALGAMLRRNTVARVLAADLMLNLAPGVTGSLFLFFFHIAKGYSTAEANLLLLAYFVGGIIGAPFWIRLARQLGKHRALILACLYYIVVQTSVVILPHLPLLAAGGLLLLSGLSYAATQFLLRALMADVSDEVRLDTGRDETGFLFSLLTSTTKLGYALAVGVTFVGLSGFRFNPADGAANGPEALLGLNLFYGFAPPVMTAIGALALVGYPLTRERHHQIRLALDTIPTDPSLPPSPEGARP